jgi:3-hydroxyacyl-CoA dehydrogenase
MDWKTDLYARIAPHIAPGAIVASNTSGLSITAMSAALPDNLKPRFCGIHFFNPPRYMPLVELIATPTTEPRVIDQLEAFVTTGLGKGVVRAKDTPNFVANRVGIAGMLSTMKEVERYGLTYDVVDDLTGKKLGRASSGTFRTADVVGLDTMAHVIKTLQTTLSADATKGAGQFDPFYGSFGTPAVLTKLLELGQLGQKAKAGFFKKVGRDVMRFDLESGEYVPAGQKSDEVYARMLKKPAGERLKLLRNAEGPQGQFVWAILRNAFHYAAVHLGTIAHTARDVDQAMRWGFGMKQGPFELWQEAGWLDVAKMVQEDIDAGKALCNTPLPAWVFEGPVAEAGGVHSAQGSFNPSTGAFEARRTLPVYSRQLFPELLLGEAGPDYRTAGTTLMEDDAIRLWTLDAPGLSDVVIASIKTKMHAISPDVAEGLSQAGGLGRGRLPGCGDLVGRRAVFCRCRPASHVARFHDGRCRRHQRGRG